MELTQITPSRPADLDGTPLAEAVVEDTIRVVAPLGKPQVVGAAHATGTQ